MSFFDDLGKKVNQTAKVVGEKSGKLVEAGKTKVEIEKIEHEMNKLYKELGMKIYINYKDSSVPQEDIEELLNKIDTANSKLEILKQE
ncbi:MAG: hypothetical protein ACOWWR_16140 [Eubacteriales bacterium]